MGALRQTYCLIWPYMIYISSQKNKNGAHEDIFLLIVSTSAVACGGGRIGVNQERDEAVQPWSKEPICTWVE